MTTSPIAISSLGLLGVDPSGDCLKIRNVTPDSCIEAGGCEVTIDLEGGSETGNSVSIGGNVADIVSESETRIIVTAPAGTAGIVDLVVTNADLINDTVPFTYVAAADVDPILTKIINNMASIVSGLRIAQGYYYDWGIANRVDEALIDRFPNVTIKISEEQNDDEENNTYALQYHNKVLIDMIVRSEASEEYENPNREIDVYHNLALDDLKKAFAVNYHLDGAAEMIMYAGSSRNITISGDRLRPGEMLVKWKVRYSQMRREPGSIS